MGLRSWFDKGRWTGAICGILELVEKEKEGKMTTEDIRRILDQKYKVKE